MDDLAVGLLLLFTASRSHAQEVFLDYGLGVFGSAKESPAEIKTIGLGYRGEFYNGFYWQLKTEYWVGGPSDLGRNGGFYIATGPTVLVDLKPVEVRLGAGFGAISNPDDYLGGSFPQFNEELYFGVRDKYGKGVGLRLEHVSSAGIYQPNRGREFVTLEISTKWH